MAEILIYDAIGDWWGGVTAISVAEQLTAMKGESEIRVRINSPGGDVYEGTAIYNQLVSHSARIVVDVDGAAMSAASLIAMAGDTIRMAENALMMIHNPWTVAMGEAGDFDRAASLLRTIKENIVTTYQARAPQASRDELSRLMDETTYLTADQAKTLGLIDEITGKGAGAGETQNRFAAMLSKRRDLEASQALASHDARPSASLALHRAKLALTKTKVAV